jgi:hypothetical protein
MIRLEANNRDRKDAGSVHGVVLIKVPREVGSFEVEEKNIESRMH